MPFERWTERVATAADERARRELLGEIGRWRAARLTDIPALREAGYAMSLLYGALGDAASAVREAKSVLSLAQTPPLATPEELSAAKAQVERLGARSVLAPAAARAAAGQARGERAGRRDERGRERPERPGRPERAERPERRDRADRADRAEPSRGDRPDAVALAMADRFDEALDSLRGAKGPRVGLIRAWVILARALALPDTNARDAALQELEADLRHRLTASEPRPDVAPAQTTPAPAEEEGSSDHPLAALIGRSVPNAWKARARILEAWHADHPDQVDALVALALDHHVKVEGFEQPAPWLVGLVGQALAGGPADQTKAALATLKTAGSYAVTAYDEAPFAFLVDVLRLGLARGWSRISLRRGVSARGEPRDRRIWTLRFVDIDSEQQIAACAPQDAPYPEGMAHALVERLVDLCPRTVLVAPGAGNADLREAAARSRLGALDAYDAAAAVASLDGLSPAPVAPPAPRPGPAPGLGALLRGEEDPTEDALAAVLGALSRLHPAFQEALVGLADLPFPTRDVRVAAFLRAAHRVAPPHARLPEGITLAVRTAVAGGTQARAILTEEPTSARYGGPGVGVVVDLASALAADGWEVDRVLRGATARERRGSPVLEALDDHGEGIWRLALQGDGTNAEVWYLTNLSPEGRAAVPQLLDAAPRVIVLEDRDDLVAWFGTLGVEAVRWGEGADLAVRAAVGQPGTRGA